MKLFYGISLNIFFICKIFFFCTCYSQTTKPLYPSLLWEITGNGLSKPSYLYGTMHVSDKAAYHLSDSFYYAISKVDLIVLEQNPETWFAEMLSSPEYSQYFNDYIYTEFRRDVFRIMRKDDNSIEQALSYNPPVINNLLYRTSYLNEDFEENTYLDMYIYQLGKKLKKKVVGIETFKEVLAMMKKSEQERVATYVPEFSKRNRSGTHALRNMIQEAYKKGDLDFIDSITNYYEDVYYVKYMLHKRNEQMARRIDSILKASTMFSALGAAHLPGERGVIELLRKYGYNVRPVDNSIHNVKQKEKIDNIAVELKHITHTATDSLYKVDVPGNLLEFNYIKGSRYYLYPDMINGAYYLIMRINTYANFMNITEEEMLKKIEKGLYENIPGKIVSKKNIKNNLFNGYEILSQTRRGDFHRYKIFVTPVEVIIFKLFGAGKFAKTKIADRFFKSIRFYSYNANANSKKFLKVSANYSIVFPIQPLKALSVSYESGKTILQCTDEAKGTSYIFFKTTFSTAHYLEEDSFELEMMAEGFVSATKFEEREKKFVTYKGYPAMDVMYADNGNLSVRVLYVINGIHYYILAARYKSEIDRYDNYFEGLSFITPEYPKPSMYIDTLLHFRVNTSYIPVIDEKLRYAPHILSAYKRNINEYERTEKSICKAENTGETIIVEYTQYMKYYQIKDIEKFWDRKLKELTDGSMIVHKKNVIRINNEYVINITLRDTNCTRALLYKMVLKGRVLYTLKTLFDAIEGPSVFVKKFFDTFSPTDTLIGAPLFVDNSKEYFTDMFSDDSSKKATTLQFSRFVFVPDTSIHYLTNALERLQISDINYEKNPKEQEKEYLYVKSGLIKSFLEFEPDNKKVDDYLAILYEKVSDTVNLQLPILEVLAFRKTFYSYQVFKKLILDETPLPSAKYELRNLFSLLADSVELSKTLFPDLLKLSIYEEYENYVYELLTLLLDKGKIRPDIYKPYLNQLLNYSRKQYKRELAYEEEHKANGNKNLENTTALLIPFYQDKRVKNHIEKIMQLRNDILKLNVAVRLLKYKIPVDTALWRYFAASDAYRVLLYQKLSSIKRTNVFPNQYKKQHYFARSIFHMLVSESIYGQGEIDTIVYVDKRLTGYKGDYGYVYVYKFRMNKELEWRLGISGLQPADSNHFVTHTMLNGISKHYTYKDKLTKADIDKVLKNLKLELWRKHKWHYEQYIYDNVDD
ncbi:MAG: TraB/GumN family protein [Cytophagaceae bacterium]|nr:TraB/GumN family protein [Cytophagaceae bacterium]MDW8456773.1 TraB/GumN family protein [Cytophagaceae bacterium]